MPNVAALRARQTGSVPVQSAAVAKTEPTNANTTTSSKSPTPLCILYGSATGNSEHIAKELASTYESMLSKEKDECYFPSVVCCELDQYKKKCLSFWENDSGLDDGQKHGVLVVCSTTGKYHETWFYFTLVSPF
jgi:sulfite reductase alpha subunit-like flavoprotein